MKNHMPDMLENQVLLRLTVRRKSEHTQFQNMAMPANYIR